VAVAGDRKMRTKSLSKILLYWASLGASIAWSKAACGTSLKWIGATYTITTRGVNVSIDADRINKLRSIIEGALEKKGMLPNIRSLAGELSWVAGIVPRVRPFVSMLWAAAHEALEAHNRAVLPASKARARPKSLVFAKTVTTPLRWLLKFLKGEHGGLLRKHFLEDRWRLPQYFVRTDASTTGMGAILLNGASQPIAYFACALEASDLALFGAQPNDSAFMPEFELLAALCALFVWKQRLQQTRTAFILQMDSMAALQAAIKMASPVPTVNALGAEISLLLEELQTEVLTGEHWRNSLNIEADALSRLQEGKQLPAALAHLQPTQVPARRTFLQVWPEK
jgi:hypothetical protein